jgi:hypothetical protein
MDRASVRSLCLICAVPLFAIAQSGDAGLSFTWDSSVALQVGNSASFDTPSQTAQMSTGDVSTDVGPLAISVTSNLQTPTSLLIGANSPQNWLKIALSNDPANCPDITLVRYSDSLSLKSFSGTTVLCVLASQMPNVSVYNGILSVQTQGGTTFIPVIYSVTPGAYLHVSIVDAAGAHEIGGQTLAYSGKQTLNFQITAQNNGTDPPPNLAVDVGLAPTVNWLTLSANTLPNVPGSLQMTLDTSRVSAGASTIVQLQGTNGGGEIDFTMMVVPPASPAIWRPNDGSWWLALPNRPPGLARQWGLSGDMPVSSDYDGDGKADFAVWRPSLANWYIIPSGNPGTPTVRQYGLPGDIPIPADYDGDRKVDLAVWRPSLADWYVIRSGNPGAPIVEQWGLPGDNPVAADYDGDGKADFAVWRPSNGDWYIIPSGNPVAPIVRQWGVAANIPVPADYDGDGKADFAVWRPGNGYWYIIPSGNPGAPIVRQWGLPGDIPVTKAPQ